MTGGLRVPLVAARARVGQRVERARIGRRVSSLLACEGDAHPQETVEASAFAESAAAAADRCARRPPYSYPDCRYVLLDLGTGHWSFRSHLRLVRSKRVAAPPTLLLLYH